MLMVAIVKYSPMKILPEYFGLPHCSDFEADSKKFKLIKYKKYS